MTAKRLKEFADLYAKGFRPYSGDIEGSVYERLKCKDPKRAYWISKWPILHCFGCGKRCTPRSAEGFQVALPEKESQKYGFSITPEQMLAAKPLLRADEAAFCLRVSRSQVYALASEGKLVRHQDLPFRVTSASVREEMGRVDL